MSTKSSANLLGILTSQQKYFFTRRT